jgi:UDP-glucose 4-epimerase
MKVVVTGGAGFIGSNLSRALAAHESVTQVVVLDDLSTGDRANLDGVGTGVDFVEGSILDSRILDDVVGDAQAVVHLAARPSVPRSLADPMASHLVNATGTMEVLEAARRHGLPQVIVASSSSVYGANPVLPKREDMAPMPVSPYAAGKLAAEAATLAYGRSFGLPVLAFRFFNVFGPAQPADHAYAAVVPAFVSCALRGEPLPIHGDGEQTRDFTYVRDVVTAMRQAALGPWTGVANVGGGQRVTMNQVIAEVSELAAPVRVLGTPVQDGDVRHTAADISLARQAFGYRPSVGISEGLAAMVLAEREERWATEVAELAAHAAVPG